MNIYLRHLILFSNLVFEIQLPEIQDQKVESKPDLRKVESLFQEMQLLV